MLNEAAFGAETLEQALEVAGPAVDFVVHGGDVVERGQLEDEWVDLFEQSEEAFLEVPLVVAPGNHEDMGVNRVEPDDHEIFNEHINQPATNDVINSGSYFSFDYNNIHFVVVNTEDNTLSPDNFTGRTMGNQQMTWIHNDVKSAHENGSDWIILIQHKPLFSKSFWSFDNDINITRRDQQAIIDEFGVDLVLQGHSHVLSRSLPLVFDETSEHFMKTVGADYDTEEIDGVEYYVNPQGTIYTLPQGAGTKSYEITYVQEPDAVREDRRDMVIFSDEQILGFNDLFADVDVSDFDAYETVDHDAFLQHFTVYEVNDNELKATTYQISGNLLAGEERELRIVDEFGIKLMEEN